MTKVRQYIYKHQIQSQNKSKGFWAHLLLILLVSLVSVKVSAQEVRSEVLKTHKLSNSKGGDVYVVIQRVENIMGVPYQLEVRGSCDKKFYKSASEAPLLNVQNYCDVKLSSSKISGNSLSFTYRAVDAKRFNQLTRKIDDPEKLIHLRPTCLKEAVEESWNLETYCKSSKEDSSEGN